MAKNKKGYGRKEQFLYGLDNEQVSKAEAETDAMFAKIRPTESSKQQPELDTAETEASPDVKSLIRSVHDLLLKLDYVKRITQAQTRSKLIAQMVHMLVHVRYDDGVISYPDLDYVKIRVVTAAQFEDERKLYHGTSIIVLNGEASDEEIQERLKDKLGAIDHYYKKMNKLKEKTKNDRSFKQ